MRKLLFILLSSAKLFSQETADIKSANFLEDMPIGSYIKDVNGDLDKFDGTWVWTDGIDRVTFKLQKVTHQLFPCGSYQDYMIGNYSYTKNYGIDIVVNTIGQTINNLPESHPMYAGRLQDQETINFIFTDVVLQKDFCRAIFQLTSGNNNQVTLLLENPKEHLGVLVSNINEPVVPYNYSFTLPNNIVLTKQ